MDTVASNGDDEGGHMKNVFILGAGASRLAGGPLMADFLDDAHKLLRQRDEGVADADEAFEDVFKARQDLRGIFDKSQLDLDNVEVLFGAIEMGRLMGKFPNRDEQGVEQLRRSMITLIFKTLESNMRFPVSNNRIQPLQPYGPFASMLAKANEKNNRAVYSWCSVITFNYDVALDHALQNEGIPFDYCLEEDRPFESLPLLKLHGSINWGVCEECRTVIPNPISNAKHKLFPQTTFVKYNLGSTLPHVKHCERPLSATPLIVPPTWDKTAYRSQLAGVWREACKQLEQAENIFVIGYSMPETDNFFRYLYALGSDSSATIRRFWVFNPDPGVNQRFRNLVGRGIENRYQFSEYEFQTAVHWHKFQEALEEP